MKEDVHNLPDDCGKASLKASLSLEPCSRKHLYPIRIPRECGSVCAVSSHAQDLLAEEVSSKMSKLWD